MEIEDKIFGPFTFREFVYLAGGAGLCFTLYKLLGFVFGAIPILAIAGFALALTFYRPNNKPFINMLESAFKYITQSRLYIWQRRKNTGKNAAAQNTRESIKVGEPGPGLSGSKLRDLAWSLDVLDTKK